jgi:hypothetical protein
MSKSLTTNALASFDGEVKHAYQMGGVLRKMVRVKTGIVGSTHRFPKMGKGAATPRVPQTDVVPMAVAHTNATATLTDWNAPEYTDIFDQAKVDYQERAELAETIAGAIGRREDQLILDALDTASAGGTVSNDIGGTDSGLNVTKLRRASRLLNVLGVPKTDRWFVGHAIGEEQLLGETEVTSSDFNVVKALVQGEIDQFLGFKYEFMEDRDEGGVPVDGSSDRTNYAFHGGQRGSTGLAVGIDFRTEVNYIAEKTSWLANGLFSAGAVVLDENGLIDVTTRES